MELALNNLQRLICVKPNEWMNKSLITVTTEMLVQSLLGTLFLWLQGDKNGCLILDLGCENLDSKIFLFLSSFFERLKTFEFESSLVKQNWYAFHFFSLDWIKMFVFNSSELDIYIIFLISPDINVFCWSNMFNWFVFWHVNCCSICYIIICTN